MAQPAREPQQDTLPSGVAAEPAHRSGEGTVSALSPAALIIGVVCVAITCCVVCYAELVVGKIQIGFLQLPPVVVGMLVLLLGAQALLARLAFLAEAFLTRLILGFHALLTRLFPRRRLSSRAQAFPARLSSRLRLKPHELFTIYVMMLLASMVSSRGLLQKLIPLLVVPNYNATPENGWPAKFFPNIRAWSVPWNPSGPPQQFVSARFFEALRPGERIPWSLWIVPLCAWGVFVGLMFSAFLCMAVLLRRQWVDNEKLAFPLVQLPLEMIRGESVGAGGVADRRLPEERADLGRLLAAVLLFGLKGLHQYFPSFPDVVTDDRAQRLLHAAAR